MKHHKILLLSALCLVSCVHEVAAPDSEPRPGQGEQDATMEATAFTAVADTVNKIWVPETAVKIYDGVSPEALVFNVVDIDGAHCTLDGEVTSTSDLYVGFYPAEAFTAYSDRKATLSIPAEQVLPNEFASMALPAAPAVAINAMKKLEFETVSSYISVNVTAKDVKSFTVSSKSGAPLSGEADITVYTREVVETRGTGEVTFKTADGTAFKKGTYKIQVLPGSYSEGFTVNMTFIDDCQYSHEFGAGTEVVFGKTAYAGIIHDDGITAPVVTVSNIAFSSADIAWEAEGDISGYNIYVNGTKINQEIVPPTTLNYHLAGLKTNADNSVEVESVGIRESLKSETATVKTAWLKEIDKGEHHITIEWQDLLNRPLTGSSSGRDNGYMIGVYKDQACTDKVYELIPYDGVGSEDYMLGNSSYMGKVSGANIYIPTKLALGSLEKSTTYYIRIRTADGFKYNYKGTEYSITSKFGNSEWSEPIEVKTLDEHVPAANEVIFENFDEIACNMDRLNGIPGTSTPDYIFGSVKDLRVVAPKVNIKSVRQCGFSTAATGPDGDYLNGKTFTSFGTAYTQSIGNQGYSFEGWHFVDGDCIRPSMGAIYIDAAQKRFVGTPLLEKNLDDTEKPCELTFNLLPLRMKNSYTISNEKIFIKRLRKNGSKWEETLIKEIPVTTPFEQENPTEKDYRPAFGAKKLQTVDIDLKKGDAVAIVGHNASSGIWVILDDILIVTKE